MRRSMRVVAVGAGAAGSAAAVAVARADPEAEVVVVGAEDRAPYNRTTVNKGLLSGAVTDDAIALPGMDGPRIEWRTGSVARSLDVATPAVELADGIVLRADAMVLATGATPRTRPLRSTTRRGTGCRRCARPPTPPACGRCSRGTAALW